MKRLLIALALSAWLSPSSAKADGSIWCNPPLVPSSDGTFCIDPPPPDPWRSCPNGARVRTSQQCPLEGMIGNPPAGGHVSGVGVVSGWICYAHTVHVEFDRDPSLRWQIPYGSRRDDVRKQGACRRLNTGFGLLFNWNVLGDGAHTMRLLKNGRWWRNRDGSIWERSFTVTTLGEEFAEDLAGACVAPDFPDPGTTTRAVWVESLQNFVIVGRGNEELD